MGLDVIIHISCKDKNRNQIESQLFAWNRENLHNLLVITGDYPKQGYSGQPKPVFDLDSVQLLNLLGKMNSGLVIGGQGGARIPPTHFFKGVAVSLFKRQEAELMMQYYKLLRKVAMGADYIITQVGYDARKFHELILFVRQNSLSVPILGNVFVPNLTVAEMMCKGLIPGCVISEEMLGEMQKESRTPDKGKKARLIRAAKLLCVLQGLGYDGAHIGGPGLTFSDLAYVLDEAERLSPSWQELIPEVSFGVKGGFYYYEKDEKTGLNQEIPIIADGSKRNRCYGFMFSEWSHSLLFSETGRLYDPMRRICLAMVNTGAEPLFTLFEYMVKRIGFACRNCGDCTLAELAYCCPQSGCAKYLLNGPCGGSSDGWCEVYPGRRKCFYVRIYERLQSIGGAEEMKHGFIPPRDWALNSTSSWINYFTKKDHLGKSS